MNLGGLAEIVAPRFVLQMRGSARSRSFEEQILIQAMHDAFAPQSIRRSRRPRVRVP